MRIIIIFSAALTAVILMLLGVRKLKMKSSPGLFYMTLCIILGAAGCGDASTKFSDDVTALEQIHKKQSSRLKALNQKKAWKDFKSFWQKLNAIKPNKKASEYMGEYAGALNNKEAVERKQILKEHISALDSIASTDKINSLEVQLLDKLCSARIEYMSDGLFSTMTRMMPPPSQTRQDDALRDLELKIDVLIKLRKKKKITGLEFQNALQNIINDVKVFSISDAVLKNYSRYLWGQFIGQNQNGNDPIHLIEQNLKRLEVHYNEYKRKKELGELAEQETYYKDIDKKYKETRQKLNEIKGILPSFGELIADLEH